MYNWFVNTALNDRHHSSMSALQDVDLRQVDVLSTLQEICRMVEFVIRLGYLRFPDWFVGTAPLILGTNAR